MLNALGLGVQTSCTVSYTVTAAVNVDAMPFGALPPAKKMKLPAAAAANLSSFTNSTPVCDFHVPVATVYTSAVATRSDAVTVFDFEPPANTMTPLVPAPARKLRGPDSAPAPCDVEFHAPVATS